MNDFDFDAKEKKRIARGAYNKKGCKSRKCTLPDDYLTPHERKALSKTLVDVNLKGPMKWDDFKRLPEDIQREYLEYLVKEYGATSDWVAKMLGVSYKTLSRFSVKGIFPKGRRRETQEQRDRWREFLANAPVNVDKKERYFVTYTPAAPVEREDEPTEEAQLAEPYERELMEDAIKTVAEALTAPPPMGEDDDPFDEDFSDDIEKLVELPYKPLPIEMDFTFGCVTAEQLCEFIRAQMRDSVCFTAKLTLNY